MYIYIYICIAVTTISWMVATFVMFAVNEQGELMSSSLSETRLLLYVDEQLAMSLHLYCSNIYIYKYIIYIYIYIIVIIKNLNFHGMVTLITFLEIFTTLKRSDFIYLRGQGIWIASVLCDFLLFWQLYTWNKDFNLPFLEIWLIL